MRRNPAKGQSWQSEQFQGHTAQAAAYRYSLRDLRHPGVTICNTGETRSGAVLLSKQRLGNQNSNFRPATRPGDFPLLACFHSTQFECLTDGTDMEDRVKRVFKDIWGFEVRPD
ncbi:hypothetical protein Bbelb_216020 [Branchiostoma belcheri]|nr:hypothetical protein Bbelb_216020 [Branchiostoma belcheri]